MNDHYLAIENREFDKLVLKSSDNLKDLSEGEALLKKILEPYKGKFVLLDVWGTWCEPCKDARGIENIARLLDQMKQAPQTSSLHHKKGWHPSGCQPL